MSTKGKVADWQSLRDGTRQWARELMKKYDFESHHHTLLFLACTAIDRAAEAREALARDGAIVAGPDGTPRRHPAVTVERDSMLAVARLLRELGLDVDPPPAGPKRGPNTPYYVGRS